MRYWLGAWVQVSGDGSGMRVHGAAEPRFALPNGTIQAVHLLVERSAIEVLGPPGCDRCVLGFVPEGEQDGGLGKHTKDRLLTLHMYIYIPTHLHLCHVFLRRCLDTIVACICSMVTVSVTSPWSGSFGA